MKRTLLFALFALFAFGLNAQNRSFEQYREASSRATHWQPVSYGTSSQTATIMGVIDFEGIEQLSNQLEIGVFYGNTCRGAGLSSVQALGRYYVFLTVYGNNGEVDTFKIYDHATQTELDMSCSQTYTYHDDDIIGSIPSPYVFNFIYNHFEINVSADPTVGGTVTGSGTYDRNAPVILTATANYGYSFTNWTKSGEQVSTVTPYSFTAAMSTMGDYVAHFAPIPYEITVTANPTTGGTVSGGGTHDYGTSVTLTATPATGYHFVNWTKNGVAVSTNTSYSFVVNGDAEYVANFELNSYSINVSANPTAGGTVTGAGTYNHFTTCTLTATPSTGYHFVNWKKNGTVVSTSATYEFEVTGGGNYVAYFELNSYSIIATANPTAGGTVTGAGTYNHFATCTLTATPATGYHFVNWTRGGEVYSTNTTISFQVTQAESFIANFAINTYEITAVANPTAGGTVTGAGTYNHFATCTLTATPATGYHFVNWTKGGEEVSTAATYAFEVSGAGDYVANFAINTYEITAVANPTAGGTVTGAAIYEHFATCTLVATPATGYHFVNWTKGGVEYSTELTISFEVTQAESFVANFEINSYEITATVNNAQFGTVTGAGIYNHIATCTLTATPATGYHFVNWTKGSENYSTEATISFEVTQAESFVANFEINNYEIAVLPNNESYGTVSGTGMYNHFVTCSVSATPATGYHFVNWTENNVEVSTDVAYTFMVEGPRTLVANFEIDTHEITVTLVDVTEDIPAGAPEVPGTVTGAGIYNYFDNCTLVAMPATGYHFVNWTEGGVEVATTTIYELMVTADHALVANFELDTHVITASVLDVTENVPAAAPEVPGTVTGSDTYNYYAICTMVATPATGYHFVNWTESGAEVSTEATYEFIVEGDRALIANFELDTHTIALSVADVTAVIPEAAPAVPGTVNGDGIYNYYAMCTVVATPATGYHFVNWTEGGVEVATTMTYEFMVTEDHAFVANFELDAHVITVTVTDITEEIPDAAPDVPGTVTGSGTYNYYEMCTMVATPATGYHFVNWTENDVEVSSDTTYEFMVTNDLSLVANFELDAKTITVTVNPSTTPAISQLDASGIVDITVDIDVDYQFDDNHQVQLYYYTMCTLTATPSIGYHFVNWTNIVTGEVIKDAMGNPIEEIYTFMVIEDRNIKANFALDTHDITVNVVDVTENTPAAAPAIPGTVTGTGTYNYYDMCTLTATPSTGYHFVNWTDETGAMIAEASVVTYEFMVDSDRAITANFELDTKTIAVTVVDVTINKPDAAPEISGTVTGADTYNYYAICTLVATPTTGYHFVNWKEGNTVVSTSATYEFMVTADRTLVANFELDSHTITATIADVTTNIPSAAPSVAGTVTGTGSYNHYATCTLVATPVTGYHFVNWSENGTEVSTIATYSFIVTEARSLVANFALDSYPIVAIVNPEGYGTITGAGNYNHYSTCTLTATATEGHLFAHWSETVGGEIVSTEPTLSFMVTEAKTYYATFINLYQITVEADPQVGGTVAGAGIYNEGTSCTLTAAANTGYHFVNWTLNGMEVSTNPSYTFTVNAAGNYIGHFALNSYEIAVTLNPAEAGTVTGAGTYNHFETCTLTAIPDQVYLFENWTLNGEVVSTEPTISFTVTGPANYVANFNLGYFDVSAYAFPTNGGTTTGAGSYLVGTTCTLTGIPNTGFHFVQWTKGTEIVSTDAEYSFIVTPESAGLYRATFARTSYQISVTANPAEGGNVIGSGTYNYGNTCQLIATANSGYHFVNWTSNGTVLSTEAIYSFEVHGSAQIEGNFAVNTYDITAVANPAEGGVIIGAGTYNYGESCTLTATEANGYNFVNWTKDNEVVSTEASFSFTVTANANYVANFEESITYEIVVIANPEDYGTVTGGGLYVEGEICTVTATPTSGHMFLNWTENGEIVSDEAEYSFVVIGNRELVANFDYDGVGELDGITFVVYPNPATDKIMIESSEFVNRCEIYTVNGVLILTMYECTEHFEVNIDNYVAGSYIVRLFTDNGVQMKQFIKK